MRWYDRYQKLAKHLDGLKDTDPDVRTRIVRRVLSLMRTEYPDLVSADSAMEFPLDFQRRRWYDKDPYLWLVMNGLSHAPEPFLQKIAIILEQESVMLRMAAKAPPQAHSARA